MTRLSANDLLKDTVLILWFLVSNIAIEVLNLLNLRVILQMQSPIPLHSSSKSPELELMGGITLILLHEYKTEKSY